MRSDRERDDVEAARKIARSALLTIACLVIASAAWPRGHSRATLVGIVLPSHVRPRTMISGSVVVNPDDYEGVPGLLVMRTEMAAAEGSARTALPANLSVDSGDGIRQPADRPFTAHVAPDGTVALHVGMADRPLNSIRTVLPAEAPAGGGRGYTMLPVSSDSDVMVIHGAFAGDARRTDIAVNGQPARKLAESSDAAYFEVPTSAPAGRNRVELSEGGRSASLDLYVRYPPNAPASLAANPATST